MPEKNIRTDDDLKDRPINWTTRGHTIWQGSFVHKGITFTIKFIGGRGGRWDVVFEQRVPVGGLLKLISMLASIFQEFIRGEKPRSINVRRIKNRKLRKLVVALIRKVGKKIPPKSEPEPVNTDKAPPMQKPTPRPEMRSEPSKKPGDKPKKKSDVGWKSSRSGTKQTKTYK